MTKSNMIVRLFVLLCQISDLAYSRIDFNDSSLHLGRVVVMHFDDVFLFFIIIFVSKFVDRSVLTPIGLAASSIVM